MKHHTFSIMNMYRQILAAVTAMILCFSVVSCSNTNAPTTDGSTLVVPTDTLRLTSAKPSDTLQLKLSCGCAFTLDPLQVTGDNTIITCTPVEVLDNSFSEHHMVFSFVPGSTTGGHSVKVNFTAHKHTYSYMNSIVVVTE